MEREPEEPEESEEPELLIGQLLLEAGLITVDQLDEALKLQENSGERVVNILMALGAIDAQQFVNFLTSTSAYPSIEELEQFDIESEIIALVSREFALQHEVVPIDRDGNELMLAMVCPLDIATIDALEIETGLVIHPFICCADDLLPCLHRHYGTPGTPATPEQLAGTMKLATAVTMLRHLEALPALPGTVQRVREMLFDDTGTASELGAVIERDPAIAAKMLKVANSPAYGFAQSIDSVDRAVSLLGLLDTYSIVVTSAVIDVLRHSQRFDYVRFWMQATTCAGISRDLAKISGVRGSGIVSAGLLHDLGRIALAHIIPDHYALIPQGLNGEELIQAEEDKLGITHTEVGYQLALHWDFPTNLAEAIRFHHSPEFATEDHRMTVHLIHVADVVAASTDPRREDREVDLSECMTSMNALGLSEGDIMGLLLDLPDSGDSFF